jgi:catechol 2,3-dioxygenase-like lactoylglutathione lyase family enzyme
MGVVTAPRLDGIHHLKVHVTDVRRSARWYARVLGYKAAVEFVEGTELVGYGLGHPRGGTLLTLRLDPAQAAKTAGWVYFEMGVPDRAALDELAAHLDQLGEPHGPVVQTPIGWLLPGLHDPDGHEMRFYFSDENAPASSRAIRLHDPGPSAWIEPLERLEP